MTQPSPESATEPTPKKIAVVTGASSGIGAATARSLSEAGYTVYVGARRVDRLKKLAEEIGGVASPLDVTDQDSVDAFVEQVPQCDVLVNNAGGAIGTESVHEASIDDWLWMYDTNVLGTLRMTRALLDKIVATGDGQVINIGSIAAREPYRGGAGYNVAKHGVAALTRVLRLEMLGKPVRVCEIDPGLVNTEFSTVRFRGDKEKADNVYAGMEPMKAEDIADAIAWVATRPPRVNIDQILMLARDQASAHDIYRHE